MPTSTSKTDIQLLYEGKEKEEKFGNYNFLSAILVTELSVDHAYFGFLVDQNSGLVITKPSIRATPLYLLKHTLLI